MKKTILLIFCIIFIQSSIAQAQTFRVGHTTQTFRDAARARDIATTPCSAGRGRTPCPPPHSPPW